MKGATGSLFLFLVLCSCFLVVPSASLASSSEEPSPSSSSSTFYQRRNWGREYSSTRFEAFRDSSQNTQLHTDWFSATFPKGSLQWDVRFNDRGEDAGFGVRFALENVYESGLNCNNWLECLAAALLKPLMTILKVLPMTIDFWSTVKELLTTSEDLAELDWSVLSLSTLPVKFEARHGINRYRQNVSFAGEEYLLEAGSLKLDFGVSNWGDFVDPTRGTLTVAFRLRFTTGATVAFYTEDLNPALDTDPPCLKRIEFQQGNETWVLRFTKNFIMDGEVAQVKFITYETVWYARNEYRLLFVFPRFINYFSYDPDLSKLIDVTPGGDGGDGGDGGYDGVYYSDDTEDGNGDGNEEPSVRITTGPLSNGNDFEDEKNESDDDSFNNKILYITVPIGVVVVVLVAAACITLIVWRQKRKSISQQKAVAFGQDEEDKDMS
ncbi:Nodule-specific Glycine Rich Peptide [Balamuthia mandrillaris]